VEHISLAEAQRRFFAYQEGENHSPKQLAHYRQTFKDFDRFLAARRLPRDVGALTSETLQEFVTWLKETPLVRPYRGTTRCSLAGVAGHLKDLRAFVRWCADEERGLVTWKVTVPRPKVPDTFFPVLSDEELLRVWRSKRLVGDQEFQVRNRALIALFLDTGLRLGELAGLTPGDIHGSGSLRFVHVLGKGGRERLVPFTPPVGAMLDAWLAIRSLLDTDRDTIFLLEPRGIQILIRRIWLETGVHVFAHKIRHSAATNMILGGADPFTVKDILGHTQIATTLRYVSMDPKDIAAKHAAASPFLRLLDSIAQAATLPSPQRRMLRR
jgi:integrase/recombinase XerC